MPGVMECSCGHRMVLERPEDAPYCCPKCGGGKIPETMSRQAQRRAKAEFAKAKVKLGPKVRSELDALSAQMGELQGQDPEPAA